MCVCGGGGLRGKTLRTVGHKTILKFLKGVGGKGVKPKDPHKETYAPSLSVSNQHYILYPSKACMHTPIVLPGYITLSTLGFFSRNLATAVHSGQTSEICKS